MPSDKNLKHSEIWDDSALLSSWNDAYQEYLVTLSLSTPSHDPNVLILPAEIPQPRRQGRESQNR